VAFTVLQKNTTITATEVNDNFYHIACGDLIPRGGTSLGATTGVYNLGSDMYRWDVVHANNIYATNMTVDYVNNSRCLIDSYEISGKNTATTRISFSLNGDAYDFLEISFCTPAQNTLSALYINGDSSTVYSLAYLYFYGTSINAGALSPWIPAIHLTCFDSSELIYTIIKLNSKSGSARSIISSGVRASDSDISGLFFFSISYNTNTSITITSLVFTGAFNTGTSIKIWGNT